MSEKLKNKYCEKKIKNVRNKLKKKCQNKLSKEKMLYFRNFQETFLIKNRKKIQAVRKF